MKAASSEASQATAAAMSATEYKRATWFTPYANTMFYGGEPGSRRFGPFLGFVPDSMPWHLTYLLALDLLIIVGVFLVDRYRWYAAAAAIPVLALIAVAGVRQIASGDDHSVVFTVGVASAGEPTGFPTAITNVSVGGTALPDGHVSLSGEVQPSASRGLSTEDGRCRIIQDAPTGSQLVPARQHDAYLLLLGDAPQSRPAA